MLNPINHEHEHGASAQSKKYQEDAGERVCRKAKLLFPRRMSEGKVRCMTRDPRGLRVFHVCQIPL
jgi:hypothetical protein